MAKLDESLGFPLVESSAGGTRSDLGDDSCHGCPLRASEPAARASLPSELT